ncbi:hypothetical protein PTTG_05286, partial [Puccinia triticina 1-1 BBBD Race 1]
MAGTRQNPAGSSSTALSTPAASDNRDIFKCPTFTGNNFPIWQRKVKTYLAVKSLLKCVEQPLPANASKETKLEYVRATAILSGHIDDHIYNHIITNQNIQDAFTIWKEVKGKYTSTSVLAISHAWQKWEDIQYKDNITKYISQLEAMLAEFGAMGLDVPDTIL